MEDIHGEQDEEQGIKENYIPPKKLCKSQHHQQSIIKVACGCCINTWSSLESSSDSDSEESSSSPFAIFFYLASFALGLMPLFTSILGLPI